MKRQIIILLLVTLFALSGCKSSGNDNTEDDIITDELNTKNENDNGVISEKETESKDISEEKETESKDISEEKETESKDISEEKETESQYVSDGREDSTKQKEETSLSTEQHGNTQEQVKEDETAYSPVGYNPNNVVALSIAKCQADGMITTQDNLANALAEGRITQEEYNEYYPYDGLENSYYSVFVETDLNKAGTTSGHPLRSEDAIATYIANMLLLESSPVFNVVYMGVYSQNGTDYYEFRCLR